MSVGQSHIDMREAMRRLDEAKQKLRERDAELVADRERYPLWCIDHGEDAEDQYVGPYDTLDQAFAASCNIGTVRRCRRRKLSEVVAPRTWIGVLNFVSEHMGDYAIEGDIGKSWSMWDEKLVIDSGGDAVGNLRAWADENLTLRLYVCEGDEPESVTAVESEVEQLRRIRSEGIEGLALVEADAEAGAAEVERLRAEVAHEKRCHLAALNACTAWRESYEDACEEVEAMRGRLWFGTPRDLADAGWKLALWLGETGCGARGDFGEDDFVFCGGGQFNVRDTLATIVAASYRMSRAETLLEQARSQADRFKRLRDESLRREAATSRALAEARLRIEELEAAHDVAE